MYYYHIFEAPKLMTVVYGVGYMYLTYHIYLLGVVLAQLQPPRIFSLIECHDTIATIDPTVVSTLSTPFYFREVKFTGKDRHT